MKNFFLLLIISISFYSCKQNKETKFIISNSSNSLIDSIKITYGTEKESRKYLEKNINVGKTIELVFDMNLKGIDGGYFLETFRGRKKTEKHFGYYSNAKFNNYKFELKIEKDTILISESLMK